MRLNRIHLVVAILALGLLAACNSSESKSTKTASTAPGSQAPSASADGVRRVTVAELKDLLAKNEAVVVDVRNEVSYGMGHIKGSKLVPLAEVANHVDQLPRNKLIVTYCSCSHEQTAVKAIQELKTMGIENTGALLGGYAAWQSAGLPVDTKAP